MPVVIESTARGEKIYDLPSRLMKDRIIVLYEDVNELTASIIMMQLLFLESQDSEKPINFYINSPGGSVSDGLAIYDTMRFLKSPVHTWCIGQACSMGAVLLAAGAKRFALPNARIMIHQPSGGARGQETEILIQAEEIKKTRTVLEKMLAEHTGKSVETIHADCERDNFMTSEEARKYGLIDYVVSSSNDMEKLKEIKRK